MVLDDLTFIEGVVHCTVKLSLALPAILADAALQTLQW
jgi:hypothetical protein